VAILVIEPTTGVNAMTNVFYTDRFIPERYDAINLFFVILIRPEFKDDKALLEHERVHTRQVLRTFGLHIIMYHASKKWRLKSELEAYKVSVKYGMPIDHAALLISNNYDLEISPTNAALMLANG
jgi:hypothetical protein